jgi:SAM-dependent methyltransferase
MNEHWARYCFAEALAGSKRILDAGCGVGYGAARLARTAAHVYGLDLAFEAVADGEHTQQAPRLRYVQGDCRNLPFRDGSLDLVVAFEVIEHLAEWRELLREARRVLRPAGQLAVSTPNRLYYGESRSEPNPFHIHEFDYEEFREALREFFPHTAIILENHADVITFTPPDVRDFRVQVEECEMRPEEAHFFLGICSCQPLEEPAALLYVPTTANVLREREQHIRLLEKELAQKVRWLEEAQRELKTLAEKHEALTHEHKEAQERAQTEIERMAAINEEKTAWANELGEEIASLRQEVQKCIGHIDDAEKRVIERTEWAQRLDRQLMAIYASRGYRISRRLRLVPEPGSDGEETLQRSG